MNKRGMDAVGFIGITIIVVAIIVLSLGGLNNVWAQIKAIMGGGDTVETVISQCSFACSRGGKSGSWAYCSIKRPMMDTTSKTRYSGTCNEYAQSGSFFSQFFLCDNSEIKCSTASLCGNGRIDSGEECDQNDLGTNIFSDQKLATSNDCTDLDSTKYDSGIVSCTACKMDLTDCKEKSLSPVVPPTSSGGNPSGSPVPITSGPVAPPVVTPPVAVTPVVTSSPSVQTTPCSSDKDCASGEGCNSCKKCIKDLNKGYASGLNLENAKEFGAVNLGNGFYKKPYSASGNILLPFATVTLKGDCLQPCSPPSPGAPFEQLLLNKEYLVLAMKIIGDENSPYQVQYFISDDGTSNINPCISAYQIDKVMPADGNDVGLQLKVVSTSSDCSASNPCPSGEICSSALKKCVKESNIVSLQNARNSQKKISLLILGLEYSSETELKQEINSLIFGSKGFFAYSPFKSYKQDFEISSLYIPEGQIDTSDTFTSCDQDGLNFQRAYQPLYFEDYLKGKIGKAGQFDYILILAKKSKFTSYALLPYNAVISLNCQNTDDKKVKVILHEIGHLFGADDEYIQLIPSGSSRIFTPGYNCQANKDSVSTYSKVSSTTSDPEILIKREALKKWVSLAAGNLNNKDPSKVGYYSGCGLISEQHYIEHSIKPGEANLIDLKKKTDNGKFDSEDKCFFAREGGGYTDIDEGFLSEDCKKWMYLNVRPTKYSIMNNQAESDSFGPINSLVIEKMIQEDLK